MTSKSDIKDLSDLDKAEFPEIEENIKARLGEDPEIEQTAKTRPQTAPNMQTRGK